MSTWLKQDSLVSPDQNHGLEKKTSFMVVWETVKVYGSRDHYRKGRSMGANSSVSTLKQEISYFKQEM